MIIWLWQNDRSRTAKEICQEMNQDKQSISYRSTLAVINENIKSVYAKYKIQLGA